MNKDAWVVNSADKLTQFIAHIKSEFAEHRFLRITVRAGIKRSLPQNALAAIWYDQIAKAIGWTAIDVKRYCKLHFGVAIRKRDPCFADFYNKSIKNTYNYEEKLKAMDFVPITRDFNRDEFTEYLNMIQAEYAEQDIVLESL